MKMGQPETAAYEKAVAEESPDLAGCGVCGNVKVLGGSTQEQVADTSPYKVGDKAVIMEPVERAQRVGAYLLPRYTVFLPGNDSRLHCLYHSILDGKSKLLSPVLDDMSYQPNRETGIGQGRIN
jgi:hypothetical protein